MGLLWRTAIVAAAIFGAVLLAIGAIAILAVIARGVLESRRDRQRQRQADEQLAAMIAGLDEELAELLGSHETGEKP